ncbi:MAG TPA: hypothetical protein VHW01_21340, partial [Polyangiaceae bacterium]|nr:hypothetical protein [Polyangiaceae bacterium]
MSAPTGGPNGSSELRRRNAPLVALAACAAFSYLLWSASAAAQTQLRVTGSLTIEASASLQRGTCEVAARLLDDAGHAVSGTQLQIKLVGGAEVAPTVHECGSRTVELQLNSQGAYLARTNDSGALCVRFEGISEHPEFELSFSDPNGLYTAASRRVVADSATRSVELAFTPAQTVIAL